MMLRRWWRSPVLAINRNFWIIFDECYGDFVHGHQTHHPIVSLVPEVRSRTVIINAFSKSLALTGWRIGYLSAPKDVVNAVKALQSHTTSNPNVIAQHAVLTHLRQDDGVYQANLRAQARPVKADRTQRAFRPFPCSRTECTGRLLLLS